MRSKRELRDLSLFGCKTAGGKVLLFYPDAQLEWKKTAASRSPEVQGPAGLRLSVKLRKGKGLMIVECLMPRLSASLLPQSTII